MEIKINLESSEQLMLKWLMEWVADDYKDYGHEAIIKFNTDMEEKFPQYKQFLYRKFQKFDKRKSKIINLKDYKNI